MQTNTTKRRVKRKAARSPNGGFAVTGCGVHVVDMGIRKTLD